jgi:phosphate starvation-inducible PhoH-like protein
MTKPNRVRKTAIQYNVELNQEQKQAKELIEQNQIVVITGKAGTGKSLISAQCSLDYLFTKQVEQIFVTRATIEVGKSLGFLPGHLDEKFNPYLEAFIENVRKCYKKEVIDELITSEKIKALPVQFIRGKTIDDILIIEEAQNLTKQEMLALLTRLGKTGKIIINGDQQQKDIKDKDNGLLYVVELSKVIEEIKYINLIENHRSDLVGKILDYEYNK